MKPVMFFEIELPGKEDVSYRWEQYVKSLFRMQFRIGNAKNSTKKVGAGVQKQEKNK